MGGCPPFQLATFLPVEPAVFFLVTVALRWVRSDAAILYLAEDRILLFTLFILHSLFSYLGHQHRIFRFQLDFPLFGSIFFCLLPFIVE